MSNPFLDDAREVKEEIMQQDAEKISDITLKNIDINLLFPKEEDRGRLLELIAKVNQGTDANNQEKFLVENVRNYAGLLIKLVKALA
jgi:hypothetical protein